MKRFTDTEKWRDPWFRRLSPPAKLLWLYLTDHCDRTGLVDPDFEAVSFHVGLHVTEKHLTELGDRVQRTVEGKIFITRFIPFQYGELSESCPAHKPVLKLVAERQLSRNGKGYQYPNATLTLPMPMGKERVQEEDKEEEENKEGEVQEGIAKPALVPTPLDIYNAYPRKEARVDGLSAIAKAIKKGFGSPFLLERTLAYAKTQPPRSRFTPLPATWFNAERFNDDPAEWTREDSPARPISENERRREREANDAWARVQAKRVAMGKPPL